MNELDSVLPVYVDYLGQFEAGVGGVETPQDVLLHLISHGVQQKRFLPNGELIVSGGKIILRDSIEMVSKVVQTKSDTFKVIHPH